MIAVLFVFVTLVALPSPSPPIAPPPDSGYSINEHQCVIRPGQATALPTASPSLHALENDEAQERRALAESKVSEDEKDAGYRLGLALDYYQMGEIAKAKHMFRLILSHQSDRGYQIDAATADALGGRFTQALGKFATDGPGFSDNTYRDSGAAYNLQRGTNALARGNESDARKYLAYAKECSLNFGPPYLIVGVLDLSHGQMSLARDQLLMAAGIGEIIPDIPRPVQSQLDAISLLLRYF